MTALSHKLSLSDHCYGKITSKSLAHGKWTISTSQNIEESRSYYSKSWHRSHGPKYTVSNRQITFKRKHASGFLTRTATLESWSGDFAARAVTELGLHPKKPKLPLSVRLNKAFDAKLHSIKRGHKIYSRTLLGEHIDWVIAAPMGTVYHDAEYSNLIRGLYDKIRASRGKINFGGGLIDWATCRKLGFCKEGITEFCNAFDFNIKGQYSPAEIERRIRVTPELAAPYMPELKTLAAAHNYNVTSW